MSDYRSNLECPDLRPHFPHMRWRSSQRAFGHEVGSDVDFDPNCESLTSDEASVLYHCALRIPKSKDWLVIGARLGWCSAHLASAKGSIVVAVDPELRVPEFASRFDDNTQNFGTIFTEAMTSAEYFKSSHAPRDTFGGCFIDGNHDAPEPLLDAMRCANHTDETAVILMHDALGVPIREGALWLMNHGWRARWYDTPNGMIVCWRGDFTPPDHVPDPAVNWAQVRQQRAAEFPFERCE